MRSRDRGSLLVACAAAVLGASGCARQPRAADTRAASPGLHAPAPTGAALADGAARYGFGRPATPEEIRAWDIDVMPDGTGLPPGRGTVAAGASLFADQCAVCHGKEGRGGKYDVLVGREPREGFPFGKDRKLLERRTIGNYWPYATTLYDYINRSMPQAIPGTLRPDEVYSLVAYLLYLNEIIPQDAAMDQGTLPKVVMPARDRFVFDNRRGGNELR